MKKSPPDFYMSCTLSGVQQGGWWLRLGGGSVSSDCCGGNCAFYIHLIYIYLRRAGPIASKLL